MNSGTSQPSCTILIPCLNEAHGIGNVVREYRSEFPEAMILVIDNASTDNTAELARTAGATVISEPRRGKARAVITGLLHVESDILIMVDGDGSYPSAGARILVEEYLKQPADMITGIRCEPAEQRALKPLHQLGTKGFALATRMAFGFMPADVFSGLRLFSRSFYRNMPILSRGFELEMELTLQAIDKGFHMTEAQVPFRTRAEGSFSKLRTFRDGFRIMRFLFLLFRDYKPLVFFGLVSGFLLVLGLAAGSLPTLEYLRTGLVGRLPLAVLAASLVNLAIFTFLTGLILESGLRSRREDFQIRVRNSRD